MNISSQIRRIILGAGLALMLAGVIVSAGNAQQGGGNTISAPGQTSIVTDKDAYIIGQPITITYTLPGPGRIRITDHQGEKVSTLRSGYSAQTSGRIQGTVTPPVGKECLKLEYRDNKNQLSTAETCFEVKDKEPKESEQPQGQTPAPGLYTLQNKGSGLMLDSNPERAVYPLASNGGSFQKWMVEAGPDGYVLLRNLATNLYLDSNPDGDVYTLGNNGGSYQQWKLEAGTDGHFILRSRGTMLMLTEFLGAIEASLSFGSVLTNPPFHWKLTAVQP